MLPHGAPIRRTGHFACDYMDRADALSVDTRDTSQTNALPPWCHLFLFASLTQTEGAPMASPFDAASRVPLKLSMTTQVIGCFLLSVLITGSALIAARFLIN